MITFTLIILIENQSNIVYSTSDETFMNQLADSFKSNPFIQKIEIIKNTNITDVIPVSKE
jgi:hypothetical protein